MVLRLLIDAVHPDETRVVIADNTRIHDFDFVTAAKKQLKGNIYLAKITRVEPSLQAAFVEYGGGKQGFLPFAEIHPDYYQIPTADRKRLMEEAEHPDVDEPDASPVHEVTSVPEEESAHADAALSDEAASQEKPAFLHASAIVAEMETGAGHVLDGDGAQAETHALPEQHLEINADFPPAQPLDALEAAAIAPEEAHEPSENSEIETLASDEDAVRQSRSSSYSRRYKIQEVVKRNQIVLVQVIKEERGNKGCSLTTFISLAGRYCVLMPNSPKGGGISRKIMSGEDRKRLKEISAELKTARGMSAIIRTAGIDRTRAEIKRDYEYLVKLWESIREQTLASSAPALIYEEGDLIKRTIRDLYSADIEEILVEGDVGYRQAKEFLKMILPSHAARVKLYQDSVPLFYSFNIEDQLASMYDPTVKLRSGGYIVLNPTEALISIDVNSGRSTGERNIEETATKTNLEAAAEVARQLRLRDLAGLIVIDFIDMMDSRNRRAVERALKDALKLDRAKIQLGRISAFGLLEMSRQRLRPSISEASTTVCDHCQGRGVIRSDASVALQVIRSLEKEAGNVQFAELKVTVAASVALYLLNSQRETFSTIEKKYDIRISTLTDETLPQGTFRLEKIRSNQVRKFNHTPAVVTPDLDAYDHLAENDVEEASPEPRETVSPAEDTAREDRPSRRGRRGGRGRRGRGERGERLPGDEQALPEGAIPSEATESREPAETLDAEGQPRRRESGERGERGGRGRRGGRRWRDRRGGRGENGEGSSVAGDAPAQEPGTQAEPQRAYVKEAAHPSEPVRQMEHPSAPVHAPSLAPQAAPAQPSYTSFSPSYGQPDQAAIPPLESQAPKDGASKKGWWRRIVES